MATTRLKTSKIYSISKDELQKMTNESSTITELLNKLGYNAISGNHRTLNKRITDDNIDLSKFKENKKTIKRTNKNRVILKDVLVENSNYSRNHLKVRLIKEGYLEYKCRKCGNTGEWEGTKLSLQLEHKNGIHNDNRICQLNII